ncbi:rhomboid family intramembrane serine protease [Rhodococcus sp. D2-41]|uniref:Rhomboid family intramembrane serine protease n=1 Tax=Speluncibacter jeojiensis TaxID=2710754 RepID=A0A9X4RFM7_9ACTN|nr:rhomboid family intramembrane serine protease [Rhodococcus sp. D2-41]MDG3008646.1 rhomboid family intramembrane serine protease [Rhodococcus sp. D2-41]MDG3013146.1 rhomboid family intramembrane serine protease [Corynebacteriales bacterium D3-21]
MTTPSPGAGPVPPLPAASGPPVSRSRWQMAAMTIGVFVAVLYVVELIDLATDERLDSNGIVPRRLDGLWGILFAPLLHDGWGHLAANTLPLLVLGFVMLMAGFGKALAATAIIWLVGGFGAWLLGGSGTVVVGASGLVFGWLGYLLARGLFTRDLRELAVGLVVLVVYGGLLWGVLPSDPRVSWQGHLCGAAAGVLAAWLLSADVRRDRRRRAVGGAAAVGR